MTAVAFESAEQDGDLIVIGPEQESNTKLVPPCSYKQRITNHKDGPGLQYFDLSFKFQEGTFWSFPLKSIGSKLYGFQ